MIPGLVSVIIPTYNRPNYLREAVNSVFAQTYPFIEILVIDDGSSEGGALTKSALKPYLSPDSLSSRLPKVTYLYQKNGGLVSAVNRGLALARGEYIQRLDDDDRLLPEKIARSVNAFQAHPDGRTSRNGLLSHRCRRENGFVPFHLARAQNLHDC